MNGIHKAIALLEGVEEAAKRIDVSRSAVYHWLGGARVPDPEICVRIEALTKKRVTRRELRPDDWHRIWPELVTKNHPAPAAA